MSKWNYKLKCGSKLRKVIYDGECMKTLELIRCAYDELLKRKLIDKDDYESYTEDFDLYDEDDEDSINYELDNLYDLCDALRVWVPFIGED